MSGETQSYSSPYRKCGNPRLVIFFKSRISEIREASMIQILLWKETMFFCEPVVTFLLVVQFSHCASEFHINIVVLFYTRPSQAGPNGTLHTSASQQLVFGGDILSYHHLDKLQERTRTQDQPKGSMKPSILASMKSSQRKPIRMSWRQHRLSLLALRAWKWQVLWLQFSIHG